MEIATFIIRDIFSVASIFLALIAMLGLLLQKKPFNDVITGTFKTALGVVILQQGVAILVNSITPLAESIAALTPSTNVAPSMGTDVFMGRYTMEIGIAMIAGFVINLLVARFTKWKAVFLTGHMLFWFPFVFVGVAVNAGLSTLWTIIVATLFTAAYYVIAPNIVRPYVKAVTGDDSFTLGHPSVIFVLVGGLQFFAQ